MLHTVALMHVGDFRWAPQLRFACEGTCNAERKPNFETLKQDDNAAAVMASMRNRMSLPPSVSGDLAPVSSVLPMDSGPGAAFHSICSSPPARHAYFATQLTPFRQLQMQYLPSSSLRLGSVTAQHAPVVPEADRQVAEWRNHDWLGEIMAEGQSDPPFHGTSPALPYRQDLSFGLQSASYEFIGKLTDGGDDSNVASSSFDMCSIFSEEAVTPISESFEVPNISEQPLSCMWNDTWGHEPHPEGSYADCGVGAPAPPAPVTLQLASTCDAQRVPLLIVTSPAADDAAAARLDGGGSSGARGGLLDVLAACTATQLAAFDTNDSFSPNFQCILADASACDAFQGSNYFPDTDSGCTDMEDTAMGHRGAGPRPDPLAMMPTIGLPVAPPAGGRQITDEELKAAMAALQDRAIGCAAVARRECLLRYRLKKLRRLGSNTIRYMKRKINADKRPRIKGRFVKAEELHLYRQGLLPCQGE